MTEHKFTDEEVIKAFENCYGITEGSCKECPMYDSKRDKCKVGGESVCLESLVYDLIKRQKAEVERLQKYNTDVAFKHYNDGIKEFAERLNSETLIAYNYPIQAIIDKVLKEMMEKNKK